MGWAFYELSGGSDFQPQESAIIEEPSLVTVSMTTDASKPSALATEGNAASDLLAATIDISVETKASLESIPTTKRLVGEIAPTPLDERIVLGPVVLENDIAAKPSVTLASYAQRDLRHVKGNRVNMRNGPGTGYSVLDTLSRNTQVEVLQNPGSGWVKLQVLNSGRIGWMAESLLVQAGG